MLLERYSNIFFKSEILKSGEMHGVKVFIKQIALVIEISFYKLFT